MPALPPGLDPSALDPAALDGTPGLPPGFKLPKFDFGKFNRRDKNQ